MTGAGARAGAASLLMLCLNGAAALAEEPARARYQGERLATVLSVLQRGGLRIVFSSELVPRELRVAAEPRARTPREVLDEILRPHDLAATNGPGGVIQIVRASRPNRRAARPVATPAGSPGGAETPRPLQELVTVSALWPEATDATGRGAISVANDEFRERAGIQADDPVRSAHAFPGAVAGDDFRSEFSVRGSPYRHVGVVVDGVATPWLRHAAYGRRDAGSVTMLSMYAVERATLRSGAYPRRNGDRLGAELDLILREGSRKARRVQAVVGTSQATVIGEGPIGRAERGSWLGVVRQSYAEWPVRPAEARSGTIFGFGDGLAKLVYDVTPRQQASLLVLAGRSAVDELDEGTPGAPGDGTNHVNLVSVGWRSTIGSRSVVSQRASVVSHAFVNQNREGAPLSAGASRALTYRTDLAQSLAHGLVEAGGELQQQDGWFDAAGGPYWHAAAYGQFAWRPAPALLVASGARLTRWSRVETPALGPWIAGEWAFRPGWTFHASAGRSYQLPAHLHGPAGTPEPVRTAELATNVDVGLGQQLSSTVRWQVTAFGRRERDIIREERGVALTPPDDPAAVPGSGLPPDTMSGSARGVEVRIERRGPTRLSGWAAYSYGRARYVDRARQEMFWGDFDQRHGLNVSGLYRASDAATVSVTFRAGTNFPIPGYFVERTGRLFLGAQRNAVRFPPYARLDVRATHTFRSLGRRATAFVEVVNVLNRANLGYADGAVDAGTGEAAGFTRPLLPRRPAAGLVVSF